MTPAEKRDHYLALADDVLQLGDRLAADSSTALRHGESLDLRGRVIAGIALKIESAFRALITDARAGQSEAMHHLKTVAESFLYFELVALDPTEETARRFLAEACHRKLKFMERIYEPELITPWREHLSRFQLEGVEPLGGNLFGLVEARHPNLVSWYRAVYALACDPSHIGDVFEFMPPPGSVEISRSGTPLRDLQVATALHHGLSTVIALLSALNEMTGLIPEALFTSLEQRLRAIAAGENVREETG